MKNKTHDQQAHTLHWNNFPSTFECIYEETPLRHDCDEIHQRTRTKSKSKKSIILGVSVIAFAVSRPGFDFLVES